MKLTDNAINLLRQRYCSHDEKPKQVFKRVAKSISRAWDCNGEYEKPFLDMIENLEFLPNSPCIRNAGYGNMNKACFVLPIEDSMESIFRTLKDSAIIFKSGGGVGYDFSELREKGSTLSQGGTSSGPISFMRIYNSITEAVKQGGFRRGASMGVMKYDHPQIMDFVREKYNRNTLNNFNLSVLVDDKFMNCLEDDDIIYLKSRLDRRIIKGKLNADDLFAIICNSAWMNGDPGLLFFDRINKDNPLYPNKPITCTNPCGEQPLHAYDSCCLGSIDLSKLVDKGEFNYNRFNELIDLGTQFLLAVNKITEFPIPECQLAQSKYNRIGLGVMGFADALIKLSIKYDSKECLDFIDKIAPIMLKRARKIAVNSTSVLSIAPTGSLSILANCSQSIEPIFSKSYTRHLTQLKVKEKREDNEYLRTAHEISPEWHLKVQSKWQEWIDSGVSKTINLPHESSISDIKKIYMEAWKMGCKGITIFRDGSLGDSGQVFRSVGCEDEDCYL